MELSVETFLESVTNPHTRKEYRYGVKAFCEWFGKSAEEILRMRQEDLTQKTEENLVEYKNRAARFEREIEKFHDFVLKQGKSINTARTATLGLRQLFRYYQMPLLMRKGTKVTKTVKTTKSFPLRIENVRAMFKVADLRERVMLSMATDLGLRMSDFIRIKKSDLPDLNQEPSIPFDIMTSKEDVIANAFLSAETVEWLKRYTVHLNQREKDRRVRAERQGRKIRENPYLFPSNGSRPITEERVNGLLKILAEKAQINTNGKSLTFHCFRKMLLSASIDSGIGLTAGKKLIGKAIPQSDDTYLTTVQLKDKFVQLKKFLTIEQTPEPEGTKEIEEFKNLVIELQKDLAQQKTIAETVTEKNIEITKDLEGMKKELAEFRTFYEIIRNVVPENLLIQLQLAKSTSDDWRVLVERARAALDEIEQKGISEEKRPRDR
jgi:site-specific recombinase XerD